MKQYSYKIGDCVYDVIIDSIKGQEAKVTVNGISFDVKLQGTLTEESLPTATASVSAAPAAPATKQETTASSTPAAKTAAGAGTPVKAPLPGVVTNVLVKVGQAVKKGETVLVLEAMKMENNIAAEQDGTISGVCCAAGDSVMEGTILLTIA